MGEHDISSLTDGVALDMEVIRSIPHQRYNLRDGTNDIALLYLEQDVDISRESTLKLNLFTLIFPSENVDNQFSLQF